MRVVIFSLLSLCPLLAQTVPHLAVDVAANRHAISPDIYGINGYGNSDLGDSLRVGVIRSGGDQTTRYNWLNDTYNSAADWYFHNFAYDDADPSQL
jgi:hypothetical protein